MVLLSRGENTHPAHSSHTGYLALPLTSAGPAPKGYTPTQRRGFHSGFPFARTWISQVYLKIIKAKQ